MNQKQLGLQVMQVSEGVAGIFPCMRPQKILDFQRILFYLY